MRFERRSRLWVPEAPNLILERGPCPRPTVELGLDAPAPRLEGWWDVKLIDAATKRVKRHLTFKNLITNAGLDLLGAASNPNDQTRYFAVGTGNTAPAVTDTTLVSPVGTRVDAGFSPAVTAGPSFAYWYFRKTATFLEANANGNLAEIGTSNSNVVGGTLWTRQLFKDGTGTPTVIVKTASDQLQVTYEVRLYSPTVDATGIVVISGVNYNYTVRAASINQFAWSGPLAGWPVNGASRAYETDVLGSTLGLPGGAGNGSSSNSVAAYVGGTYYRDQTAVWEPGNGNFASGIGSILLGNITGNASDTSISFQCSFSPKIPKTSTKRLTLVTRVSWGRYP